MKIIFTIIVLSINLSWASNGYSQNDKLSVNMKQKSVREVFSNLEKSSGYRFFYNDDIKYLDNLVSVEAEKETLKQILDGIFKQTDFEYKILENKLVVVSLKEELLQAKFKISGNVTSSDGQSMVGVTVSIKGTSKAVITDANGIFNLEVTNKKATLVFSFIGYVTQEYKLNGESTLNIVLGSNVKSLDEVVVIGYGSVKKKNITGAISNIKADALENRAIASVGEALAGQLAGVHAQQISGKPGQELSIKIRGTNTISASINPLYIVDGIPVSDMKDLNQNDIASIEVLKDASSSSIYGARGAEGVVIITTKQGKAGKSVFDFSMNYGVQQVDKIVDVMNTKQQAAYTVWNRNEGYLLTGGNMTTANSARPSTYQYPASLLDPSTLPDNNWQKIIFRDAPMKNYQFTASGGSNLGTYFISGSYLQQDGIVRYTGYNRVNLRLNTTLNAGKFVKFGMNIAPSFSEEHNPDDESKESALHHATALQPWVAINSNTQNWGYTAGAFGYPNPLERLAEVHDQTNTNKILTNVFAEFTPLKELTFRSQYGYNVRQSRWAYFKPINVNQGNASNGSSNVQDWYDWSFQNTLTFQKVFFKDFDLNLLAGQSIEGSHYNNISTAGTGYPNDLIYTLNVVSKPTQSYTAESATSLASFFGRMQLNAYDKYLFTASLRRDGSSKFGPNTKWGMFPSGSIGWKLSSEKFLKNAKWLSLLKVRAAYGKTGNNSIGDYASVPLLGIANYNLNGAIISGLAPSSNGNPNLSWETTLTKDLGIDFSAFNNRVQANIDYYDNKTKNLLLNVPVPYMSGFSSELRNIGKVENKGWEFELTTKNLDKVVKWTTSFNISTNKNKVLQLGPGNALMIMGTWGPDAYITEVGQPVGSFYMYKTDGLLLDKDFDATGKAIVPIMAGQLKGNFKIVDENKDGVINAKDECLQGSSFPDFTWGITNTFQYKGFDLRIMIQGSQGGKIFYVGKRQLDNGNALTNQLTRWIHCWKPDYTSVSAEKNSMPTTTVDMSWDGVTPYPYGVNPSYNSTWLYDASFVRIKNITLGYDFPQSMLKRIYFSKLRIFITADNVKTWNHYPGASPEANTFGNNTTTPGTDYSTYPISKKISFGINLTF